jgi:predicted transcriptional regulator
MARTPKDVTDAEMAILQQLWEHGQATVGELSERLYGGREISQQATVQKLLDRLERKSCVVHHRGTWPHTFEPAVGRDDVIGWQLQQTADKLCGGALQPLLTHLVKTGGLSAKDRRELRDLLDELNDRGGKPKKK